MLDAKPMSRSFFWEIWGARFALPVVVGYQVIALLTFLIVPFFAANWFKADQAYTSLGAPAVLYPLFAIGLIYLVSGLWVLSVRRHDSTGRAFALFAASTAIGLATFYDLNTTQQLSGLWTFALAMTGGALIHLAFVFPEESPWGNRYPFVRWLGYLPALGVTYFALAGLVNPAYAPPLLTLWRIEFAFVGLATLFFLVRTLLTRTNSPSPIARAQARLVMWGIAFSLGPIALWLTTSRLGSMQFSAFLLLPLAAIPLVTSYAILRYRLLNTDYILSRGSLYALLSLLAAFAYGLVVTGLGIVLGVQVSATNPFLIGTVVVLLTLLLNPARQRLQQAIDGLFFRGQRAYQEKLSVFNRALSQTVELREIVHRMRQTIQQTLLPAQLHVYIHDPLSDQYVASLDEAQRASSDIRFPANSALAQTLTMRQSAYFIGALDTQPRGLQEDWARMALLGAQFFIPLLGQNALIGWLALGPRRSGEPYSDRDLAFLEALGDQAALAIERAQVVADLERRVHQMNVLTRVAQGVNITLAFDDLLELLFAQTAQVLPTQDFLITLYNEGTQTTYHAFFLTANERLPDLENQPLAERQGLATEIIRSGRSLITVDYERECRKRAVLPVMLGVYAWMGVPLNTSDATIGAICLGSRDPAVVYTEDQEDILQAIADQAAGAIAKARLLQETQRRARQLATLNQVAQTLSSTLELEPLLDLILHSAVEILDCEAGSLFLIDEGTGELVFEVTAGPVAADLIGQRLPPGTGLVGKSAETGEPIIANDVHLTEGWSQKTDQQTGFVTRALLVVPLKVKELPIGVLEVINKRDGSPFTSQEQELLTVFTGQAAVAIENARLYTLTDQALADRVEELSVMQRIDRELNASLDMSRTMQITLDWAMRQSRSDAGAVGFIDESGLQVIATKGVMSEDGTLAGPLSALGWPIVDRAILSGSIQQVQRANGDEGKGLHPEAQSQVAIPIRREAEVIGLLLLESEGADHYTEERLRFLTRLSDHAAIAISNAHYYAEVQEANIAKSDFVSFVSHELKTPMTSIKGYADLLSTGAVGSVNDAQANFLGTIRANVDRMATLVSDLADISRIEAGRLRLEFEAVSIRDVVDEVVRSAKRQIEEKDHELTVDIPLDLPSVWGDRMRLIQVLTNLVSNANKYTPVGGQIQIKAEQAANQWDPEGAAQVIRISVKDTGIGISPEDQKKIFQKFFRSEDEKAREAPGTGLGLNITKSLVDMQGGQIWFDSVYRKGSTFHFTVPVTESPSEH